MVQSAALTPPSSRSALSAFWQQHGATVAALAIVLVGAALRLRIAAHEVSTPMIDENEIVEQAVAFMGGDLEQRFVKYGPLVMYVLAGLYRVAAAMRGLPALDYASRVFFQGEEHYFMARAITSLSLSVLALVAFLQLRRTENTRASLVAVLLLGLPCVDVLATGARIDMPQAAFQGLSLLALGAASVSGSWRAWLGAGLAAGFAIACKPLPGALIAPCFPLASWFASRQRSDGQRRPWLARLGAALGGPGLWIATVAAIAAALVADPAILNISGFIASQRAAVTLHSGPALGSGPSIASSFILLGVPFCTMLLACYALVLLRGTPPARLVALFLAVYLAAFWGRSRHYFLVAAAVAACLIVAHGVAVAEQHFERTGDRASRWRWPAAAALALVLLLPPSLRMQQRVATPSARREAQDWIHANVPSGTRLYYVGRRGAGPPLVADKAGAQAKFGDHFDYGREHYPFLKQAFDKGYADYVKRGAPRYGIADYRSNPSARALKKTPRAITDQLLKTVRAQKRRYIIVAGYSEPDVQALGYTWFKQAVLEREFGKVAIFRVPDENVARDSSSDKTMPAAPVPSP